MKTIILGLGSNIGDRLSHLRNAYRAINAIPDLIIKQTSPVYVSDALLPIDAPTNWNMPYLNCAMRCETTQQPHELLSQLKNIEWGIGRKPEKRHWGPRIIDIDMLAWEEEVISDAKLTVPHPDLLERPFALWPLADVAPHWHFPLSGALQGKTAAELVEKWGSRFTGEAPFHTKQLFQRIDTPQLVGIINVPPDSFSDGGTFFSADSAYQQARRLVDAGADIIDIGAESTAPNAKPLTPDTEWQRLQSVLDAIHSAREHFIIQPKVSIDTYHAEVAEKALKFGVDWINDVTGLQDPAMRKVLAEANVDCVMMHHLSIPASRDHVIPPHQYAIKVVYAWAEKQLALLEQDGIARNRVILDPGIGFGKVPEHSLALIKHINVFSDLGARLLVGHSRKSFLSLFTNHPGYERDIETLAVSLFLSKQHVDYLRIHQVELCARAMKVAAAL